MPPGLLPRRYVVLGMIFVLGIASLIMYWWYVPSYGAGVDEASYFLAAKGLATHLDPAYRVDDPVIFVPENMVEARPGVFYPKYPIGYPLLIAVAYAIGGPAAGFLVSPILLVVAIIGVFFLSRLMVDDLFALAAAFFIGLHPAVLHFGAAALSHSADLAFSTWCLFFVLWWYKKPHALKALAAGLLLAYAVSIRYTEALLVLPAAFLAGARVWDAVRKPEPGGKLSAKILGLHVAAGIAGGVLGALPLLWYHWTAFGSPFRTGYSLTGEAGAFSLRSFLDHFLFAIKTLGGFATGLSLLLPLAAIGLATGLRKDFRATVFLALWCLPTLLLYAAYYWINRQEPVLYVRFFLTLFPGLILAALLFLDRLAGARPVIRHCIATGIILLGGSNLLFTPNQDRVLGSAIDDLAAAELAKKGLPADAVVVADEFSAYTLAYYTDMTIFYPRYFMESWVSKRLRPAELDRPADFNPLRRDRFAAALGGRDSEALNEIIRQRLLAFARQGRTVALVVFDESANDPRAWHVPLASAFAPSELPGKGNGVTLYRLTPK